jgi:hypothetical protein
MHTAKSVFGGAEKHGSRRAVRPDDSTAPVAAGKAESPCDLYVTNEGAEIRDASPFAHENVIDVYDALTDELMDAACPYSMRAGGNAARALRVSIQPSLR